MRQHRYDIYALIHKGLRSCLTDALVAMGRADLRSDTELDGVMEQVTGLLEICRGHLKHENEFIHTAMEAREPGVAGAMYHHHDHHLEMIDELWCLVTSLRQCPVEERTEHAAQLYRKLAIFVADNLAHMHEEETVNNAVLWRHYSDAEIQAIEHRLVASIPAADQAIIMRWMLTAMNHQERESFLADMRGAAPEPVFDGVLGIARTYLPGREWNKLELALAG